LQHAVDQNAGLQRPQLKTQFGKGDRRADDGVIAAAGFPQKFFLPRFGQGIFVGLPVFGVFDHVQKQRTFFRNRLQPVVGINPVGRKENILLRRRQQLFVAIDKLKGGIHHKVDNTVITVCQKRQQKVVVFGVSFNIMNVAFVRVPAS